MNNRKGKLFVVAAPSGAGKSSLIQSILSNFENIELSISATTRSPREGEVEGKHYFFVTENEFNSLKEEEAFIECAIVHNYQYGTLHKYIDEVIVCYKCKMEFRGFKNLEKSIKLFDHHTAELYDKN